MPTARRARQATITTPRAPTAWPPRPATSTARATSTAGAPAPPGGPAPLARRFLLVFSVHFGLIRCASRFVGPVTDQKRERKHAICIQKWNERRREKGITNHNNRIYGANSSKKTHSMQHTHVFFLSAAAAPRYASARQTTTRPTRAGAARW